MELSQTATGKPKIVVARDVSYEAFPYVAQEFVDRFGLSIDEKIDGPAERMWLVQFEGNALCVSWDEWFFEVSVMPWGDTPGDVILELHRRAGEAAPAAEPARSPRRATSTAAQSLAWDLEQLPDGVLRVAFSGRGGIGSEGNADGERMQDAIREALARCRPRALVIDLCDFEYRFGNWIGAAALTALRALGRGRVCVLASGKTAAALRPLWEGSKLDHLIPLVGEPREALLRLTERGAG